MASDDTSAFSVICDRASALGLSIGAEELAAFASDRDLGGGEPAAIADLLAHLVEKRKESTIETLPGPGRLPRREPRTFGNFDFSRTRGRDAGALGKLPALADLHARRNVALVSPGGIGKTHLAQAYGHECCLRGPETYYLKATEPGDRLSRAVERGNASKVIGTLVKPSCLIIDEVGRCVFDKGRADLISGAVDRRHGKEAPNTLIPASNVAPSGWDEFLAGDDTLLCASGRVSGKASVLVMRGPSFRGRGLDTFSVEALPQATGQRGAQPTMP